MTLVWYAAYGSNLSRTRFDYYLRGGRPVGASDGYPGCRDSSPPREDRHLDLCGDVEFAGPSQRWAGGVAFFSAGPERRAKSRAYLITAQQFDDVLAQENHVDPGLINVGPANGKMRLQVGSGWYGLVVGCGELAAIPVLTITRAVALDVAAPSPDYLRHIVQGLREAHAMTDDEIVDYLAPKRGIAGSFNPQTLFDVVGSVGP